MRRAAEDGRRAARDALSGALAGSFVQPAADAYFATRRRFSCKSGDAGRPRSTLEQAIELLRVDGVTRLYAPVLRRLPRARPLEDRRVGPRSRAGPSAPAPCPDRDGALARSRGGAWGCVEAARGRSRVARPLLTRSPASRPPSAGRGKDSLAGARSRSTPPGETSDAGDRPLPPAPRPPARAARMRSTLLPYAGRPPTSRRAGFQARSAACGSARSNRRLLSARRGACGPRGDPRRVAPAGRRRRGSRGLVRPVARALRRGRGAVRARGDARPCGRRLRRRG